ncbi:MAG TPA: nucleoside diphosphate kinase regulator [Devosia sp.]|nr:nucleoside diphosphate kinase regulator [Devosia sp.]
MTTVTLQDFSLSPDIVIGRDEHRQLTVLALAGTDHTPDISDDLLYELERADIVPDVRVPHDVVRMGSRVAFRTGDEMREVELVYPADADIAEGRISVLTPVGTALIGLRAGQSITWRTRNGRKQVLTIVRVSPPIAEESDDPGPSAA